MRIVGVSQVLNEAPVVEPFVRHHAKLLDLHIVLDNGSTDETLPILRVLQSEGVAIEVYQAESVLFVEPVVRTGLYFLALQHGADWVALLDCDELIDARRLPHGLRPWLAQLPSAISAIRIPVLDHLAPTSDTAPLANPFERLVRRQPAAQSSKILLRGLAAERVVVAGGSHGALIDGEYQEGVVQDRVVIAHYPERSPLQAALKAAIGRLKVLADGATDAKMNYNCHVEPFEAVKTQPRRWLAERARNQADCSALVEEPTPYLGGSLRYTAVPDDDARLVSLTLTYAERLARSHGALLDQAPGLRLALREQAAFARRLF